MKNEMLKEIDDAILVVKRAVKKTKHNQVAETALRKMEEYKRAFYEEIMLCISKGWECFYIIQVPIKEEGKETIKLETVFYSLDKIPDKTVLNIPNAYKLIRVKDFSKYDIAVVREYLNTNK